MMLMRLHVYGVWKALLAYCMKKRNYLKVVFILLMMPFVRHSFSDYRDMLTNVPSELCACTQTVRRAHKP